MARLHVDPIGDKPKESEKTKDQVQGDTAQALEMFSKIAAKKITEDERHPMTQKIIDDVLRKINDADVVPDGDTSLAQEEQSTEKDPEVADVVVEKQVSNEEDPKDDTQSFFPSAFVLLSPAAGSVPILVPQVVEVFSFVVLRGSSTVMFSAAPITCCNETFPLRLGIEIVQDPLCSFQSKTGLIIRELAFLELCQK
ncbi:hypothetical protein P8452_56754 [Trifolium repens]|nr:hypothetical protein P8452_56754 [Trifolium repens]